MIRDGFYEESAISSRSRLEEKLYTAFKVLAVLLFILAGLLIVVSFGVVSIVLQEDAEQSAKIIGLVQWFGLIAIILGGGIVFWLMKNKFNVSYDYTFVEDEIRITKVFNGKRRKFLYKIQADRVLAIGWVDSEAYKRTLRGISEKSIKRCTPNKECPEGKEWIYITQSTSMEKAVYILECRRQLLENIVFAAGRNKLEQK